MEEEFRPLKSLTDRELIELWNKTDSISDFGQEGFDVGPLTIDDLVNIRTSLLVQIALCEKNGIPYPKLNPDSLSVGEFDKFVPDNQDNYLMCGEMLEVTWESLHKYMDRFTDLGGIGDFTDTPLCDVVYFVTDFRLTHEYHGSMLDKDALTETLRKAGELEKHREEIALRGYLELADIAQEEPEYFECYELRRVGSHRTARIIEKLQNPEFFCENKADILRTCEEITSAISRCAFFWVPLEHAEQVIDGEWVALASIINYSGDEEYVCSLHKNTCVRIGAYILQEFALRYACA